MFLWPLQGLSTIIPLIKCKSDDLSDVNNYRAIALSNVISKFFEHLVFHYITSIDDIDIYQFGFKKRHSTADCTYVFKHTVDYYRRHGSHVFACFVDFSKAFDSVDYWQLFCKIWDLSECPANRLSTRLLAFWYSQQQMCVHWQNVTTSYFSVSSLTVLDREAFFHHIF